MAKEKDKQPGHSGRRSFLSRIWIFLGLVALVEYLTAGFSFFVSGRKKEGNVTVQFIDAGETTSFLPGTVTLIRAANCYLSCLDDGGLLAISRKCTHLGCAVPWVSERSRFECPCHASVFDQTGQVIQSPAPRALDLFPIHIEHNTITIEISRPIRRSSFDADQLTYPQELG